MAVTAFEARNPRVTLRVPAQWIAYITAAIYLVSIITFSLNVAWDDVRLPDMTGRKAKVPLFDPTPTNSSTAVVVIAVNDASLHRFASFLNASLILAILSAANTALYGMYQQDT